MITTIGPRADRYAARLGTLDLEAIICDANHVGEAVLAAVERRVAGVPFYGMVLFDDSASLFTMLNGSAVIAQRVDYDEKWGALDALSRGTMSFSDGTTVAAKWPEFQRPITNVMMEFFTLCDAVLVRSQAEYFRFCEIVTRPRPTETIVAIPAVPMVERVRPERPAVVIWAPDRAAEHVLLYAFALNEFHGEVTCVTSDGAVPRGTQVRGMTPTDPALADVLSRAACIVCTDPSDPGPAITFAQRGYGIVAPLTAGVDEFVRGAVPLVERSLDEVYAAVVIAMGRPAQARTLPPPPPPAPWRSAMPLPAEELPRVSIIIPTYNRRADLTRTLSALRRQTYPNLEILVVNDAGTDVGDIVAAFPGARYLVVPENGGAVRAELFGIEHASGDYIQLLADDDVLQPDHVALLVGAMLHSGAAMAHGNCLIRTEQPAGNERYRTTGFCTVVFNFTATPTIALIATAIAGNALMVHRRVFDEIGPYRADCILADQEFQMRALQRFAFVYSDNMTAEWRSRGKENFSASADSAPELERMYRELHPRPERPHLEQRRRETVERVASRPKGGGHIFPATVGVPLP